MDEEDKLARQKGGRIVRLMEGNVVGMTLFQYEDILFGAFVLKYLDITQTLKCMKQLEHRPDDVLLCTYPKSGTHWMSNILHMMLSTKPAKDVTAIDVPNIELATVERIKRLDSPRIIHSHLRFERLPTDHVTNGGKIILTLRNPKDVIVSLYYHAKNHNLFKSKLSWSSFLKYSMSGEMMMGSYFEYLRHWDHVIRTNKELNILVVYYENLIKNPYETMLRIREFLGLHFDDNKIRDVISGCSLDKLRTDANNRKGEWIAVGKDKKSIIYRKGVIGDWMNHFTVAENEEIDQLIRDELSDTMFRFDYYPTTPKSYL